MSLSQAQNLAIDLHARTGNHYAVVVRPIMASGEIAGWEGDDSYVARCRDDGGAMPKPGYRIYDNTQSLLP